MLVQFDMSSQRIATANRQIQDERLASNGCRLQERRTRQQITLIDELIAVLEKRNLDGLPSVDPAVRQWLRRLEAQVGLPIPRNVIRARTTARLHSVLLDWMETVLDELIPERRRVWGDPELD